MTVAKNLISSYKNSADKMNGTYDGSHEDDEDVDGLCNGRCSKSLHDYRTTFKIKQIDETVAFMLQILMRAIMMLSYVVIMHCHVSSSGIIICVVIRQAVHLHLSSDLGLTTAQGSSGAKTLPKSHTHQKVITLIIEFGR